MIKVFFFFLGCVSSLDQGTLLHRIICAWAWTRGLIRCERLFCFVYMNHEAPARKEDWPQQAYIMICCTFAGGMPITMQLTLQHFIYLHLYVALPATNWFSIFGAAHPPSLSLIYSQTDADTPATRLFFPPVHTNLLFWDLSELLTCSSITVPILKHLEINCVST